VRAVHPSTPRIRLIDLTTNDDGVRVLKGVPTRSIADRRTDDAAPPALSCL